MSKNSKSNAKKSTNNAKGYQDNINTPDNKKSDNAQATDKTNTQAENNHSNRYE